MFSLLTARLLFLLLSRAPGSCLQWTGSSTLAYSQDNSLLSMLTGQHDLEYSSVESLVGIKYIFTKYARALKYTIKFDICVFISAFAYEIVLTFNMTFLYLGFISLCVSLWVCLCEYMQRLETPNLLELSYTLSSMM